MLVAGCASIDIQSAKHSDLNTKAHWAVLPFANNTDTPLANDKAAAMTSAILQVKGESMIGNLPAGTRTQELLGGDWKKRYDKALNEANQLGAEYAIAGSVDEWNYKAGINAEPAVAITLWIINTNTQKILWTGVASANGGSLSHTSTSSLAQRILTKLVNRALNK
jgi:TolB-like protein